MKRIIINADDLGADEGRNGGIFEVLRAGVVRSATILPNGPALDHALEKIRSDGFDQVSFGVHLNLTEGKSLSEAPSCLTDPDGNFLGKAAAHRLLMQAGDGRLQSDIAREITLQIRRLLDAGIGITHIDGHQHVHVFPAVLGEVFEAARRFGICRMRIPDEPVPVQGNPIPDGLLEEARFFSDLGRAVRQRLDGTKIVAPQHFRGLLLKGRLTDETLLKAVGEIPEGITELMVHPGRWTGRTDTGPFGSFSTIEREREVLALLNPRFQAALGAAGVKWSSYREVVPWILSSC